MTGWTRSAIMACALLAPLSGTVLAQDGAFAFELLDEPAPLPQLGFQDRDGRDVSLEEFAGKYVLLNVWATWCAPCRQELPSLEALQDELGGEEFRVIALSTDSGRMDSILRLYRDIGLDEAAIYVDESGTAMRLLSIYGLPATLLIDPSGREIGRKTGAAEWDSPAALAFFRAQGIGTAVEGARK